MVRASLILAGLMGALTARAEINAQLKMEFSKPEIYVGEHVLVNFDLFAQLDALEAEVVKFPEFRGYWSENLVLRQGPISLGSDLAALPWRRATIGTYLLTAMISKNEPTIEPMKLVVRRLGGGGIDVNLSSMGTPLTIKPLPPVPEGPGKAFRGAVGNFNFFPETTAIAFRKDEPVSLRFVLQGEGNFQEVNDLGVPLPSELEVVSSRSYTQGTGQFSTKTFEITVLVHSDKNLIVPATLFTYFNPVGQRYETVQAPPIALQWQPPVAEIQPDSANVDLGEPALSWSPARRAEESPFFWALHLGCALGILGVATRGLRRRRRYRHRQSFAFKCQQRLQAAIALAESGNTEGFLRQADELAFDILARKVPWQDNPLTRARAIGLSKFPPEALADARAIFDAYEKLSFTPVKAMPPSLRGLQDSLSRLARRAA